MVYKHPSELSYKDEDKIINMKKLERSCKIQYNICIRWGNKMTEYHKKSITKTTYAYAIEKIARNPFLIDEYEMTPELCMFAVKRNGCVLRSIPKNMHTEELCKAAVTQNGISLKYVSENIVNEKICMQAIRNDANAIEFIPANIPICKLYTESVKQNGQALKYIPVKSRTKRRCMLAVTNDGLSVEYVPEKLMSKEIYYICY